MRTKSLFAAAALMAAVLPALAGGFFLMVGHPDASAEAKALKAVFAIKAEGCGEPDKATVAATAIGLVNGKRQSLPLQVTPLSQKGMFAITRQWPAEGQWVIQLVGREPERLTTTLVPVNASGFDRGGIKQAMRAPAEGEAEQLLASRR